MISIKFEIPNNYDIILYKIFEDLDLSNSIIKICDELTLVADTIHPLLHEREDQIAFLDEKFI